MKPVLDLFTRGRKRTRKGSSTTMVMIMTLINMTTTWS